MARRAKAICRTHRASMLPRPGSPRVSARQGMVLILVLIVVMILALAGFGFAEFMLTENKAAHLHGDELRLHNAEASAVEFLKRFAESPVDRQQLAGGSADNPLLFRGVSLLPEDRLARTPTRQLRFSVVAPLIVEGENRGIRFGLENESGRLHLADLLRWDAQQSGFGRQALAHFPGMTPAVADAILDWIDADDQPREMGAESDYYSSLERPYAPRNGLPECVEELLLVKGVTRELLFGTDTNYNYQLDPEELLEPAGTQRARSLPGAVPWASLLTLYSGQRNLNSAGGPRIDLNGPDLVMLQQQLTAALDAQWAAFVVAYRQFGPYAGAEMGSPSPPVVSPGTAPRFTISSLLELAGARVAIPSSTPNQPPVVHTSPLSAEPQSMNEQLPKLFDQVAVHSLPLTRGGVSVNHAPRSVLLAVPEMSESLADRIVAARGSQNSTGKEDRKLPTWILTEGLVDLPTMKRLLPNINAGGDVVRGQVVAHFDEKGPTSRSEVVIDAAVRPARQVLGRDLRLWGAGFSRQLLSGEITAAEAAR